MYEECRKLTHSLEEKEKIINRYQSQDIRNNNNDLITANLIIINEVKKSEFDEINNENFTSELKLQKELDGDERAKKYNI